MSFRRMRLIPEFMYEKLNQEDKPRSVDFGDVDNARILDMSRDISLVLKEEGKPIEEKVRMLHQHLIRRMLANKQTTDDSSPPNIQQADKKERDKEDTMESKDSDKADETSAFDKGRAAAILQRNDVILKTKVSGSGNNHDCN